MFEVTLRVLVPDDAGVRATIDECVSTLSFPSEVLSHDEESVTIRCRDIKAEGFNSCPEALRLAQMSLSSAFRASVPLFAEKGLLWKDVRSAAVDQY